MILGNRLIHRYRLLCLGVIGIVQVASGQSSILNSNLIVNGGAEAGPTGSPGTLPTSIPGWTSNAANVLAYNITGLIQSTDPAPPDHGFNYFTGGPNTGAGGTLTQEIDISSGASLINTGNIKFVASAYLGSAKGAGLAPPAQMAVAFKNANGQTFTTVNVGPLGYAANGMSLQTQVGLVPVGTVHLTITLTLTGHCLNAAQCAVAAADSLSVVLSQLSGPSGSVLGTNLITNGNAEAGAGVKPGTAAGNIPGWSSAAGASVSPYGGTGWIATTDPGPADRGVNLFTGGMSGANMYQDLDVTAAANLIDQSVVTYETSAWLGGLAGTTSPTITYAFYDWTGKQLATTATLGPTTHPGGAALVELSKGGTVPAGTRRVHLAITFPSDIYLADDINFILAAPPGPPVITPGGIVSASAFGGFTSISPGSWIEIYGTNFSTTTQSWGNSDFTNGVGPTTLGGVSVSVGGKPAYVDYVSPGQVNALVSSDAPFGGGSFITVANANGTSDQYPIYINQTQAGLLTLNVNGKAYVAGINSDGTYTLPTNAISGVASRPAHIGETITLYGVGFGPVNPSFPAGTIVTAQNSLTLPILFTIGGVQATTPAYYGLAPSLTGLYQFNVVIPRTGANNGAALTFTLGGVKADQSLLIAVQN